MKIKTTKTTGEQVLLSVPQAAQALQVSEKTVRQLEKAGALKSKRIGSRVLFEPDELKDFVSRL